MSVTKDGAPVAVDENYCFAVDLHNPRQPFEGHIFCTKPKGHEGDHANERYVWPAAPSREETQEP